MWMQGDVTVTHEEYNARRLTPSKFICNCNGVFKRKSSFGSNNRQIAAI